MSESEFILSLSRCHYWAATGGKSSATWQKTLDDRFVIKRVPAVELEAFLDFAPAYFEVRACASGD